MRVRVLRTMALGFAILAAACVTGPQATKASPKEAPPQWVRTPPAEDDQFMYFTGSGSDASGNLPKAEEAARIELIDSIMRFIGVEVTAQTTATAKSSLDSFQSDMTQTLTSTSSGRISGLEVTERWTEPKDKAVTLYLLARYKKADLSKEKKRLEDLGREKVEAVSGPEREAKELESDGRFYQAAVKYIEAAAAAYKSDIDNARLKFERNVTSAREALQRLNLVKVNDNLTAFVGEPFPEPFTVKVTSGSGAPAAAEGVPVKFSFKEMKTNGKKSVRSETQKSDPQGLARFAHPAPEFVGAETVIAAVDLGDALQTLDSAPKELQDQVESLETAALAKKVTFALESVSKARVIPTGVALFELDASGNAIALTDGASGLLESLTRSSFQVRSLDVDLNSVLGRPDAQIIALLRKSYGSQVGRAIYGTARIANHEQDGSTVIITVSGSVKVVDLLEEKVLLTVNRTKRAQGSNATTALSAAFKSLGEEMGDFIKNNLR